VWHFSNLDLSSSDKSFTSSSTYYTTVSSLPVLTLQRTEKRLRCVYIPLKSRKRHKLYTRSLLVSIMSTTMPQCKTFLACADWSKGLQQKMPFLLDRPSRWDVFYHQVAPMCCTSIQYTPIGILIVPVLPPAESLWVYRPPDMSRHVLGRPPFALNIVRWRVGIWTPSNTCSLAHPSPHQNGISIG